MGAFKWHPGARQAFQAKVDAALTAAAEAVRDDLSASGTMPFAPDSYDNAGATQRSLVVVPAKGGSPAQVATDIFMAKRMYYHPEWRWNRDTNPGAGAMWFEPYKGEKREVAAKAFAKAMGRG